MENELHFHIPLYAARGIANALPREAQLAFLALATQSPESAADLVRQIIGEIEVQTPFTERSKDRQVDYLVLIALEYALPRMTASGEILRQTIEANLDSLQDETKAIIVDKVRTKIAAGHAGDRMDMRAWEAFVERIQATNVVPKI
jgi:hypothetical protein